MSGSYHYQPARETTVTTTGNIDDLDFDSAGLLRMNNAALSTLRGLASKVDYAAEGLWIVSLGAGNVDIAHQDANSSAANRIITPTAATVTLTAGTGRAFLIYDLTTARWRLVYNA